MFMCVVARTATQLLAGIVTGDTMIIQYVIENRLLATVVRNLLAFVSGSAVMNDTVGSRRTREDGGGYSAAMRLYIRSALTRQASERRYMPNTL